MLKRFLSLSMVAFAVCSAFGQAEVETTEVNEAYQSEIQDAYNPNSINPIVKYEHHYKVRVWRELNLEERQNRGFFAKNGEITKLILDAIESGELTDIYTSDSLVTKMSVEDFKRGLIRQEADQQTPWDPQTTFSIDEVVSYNGRNYIAISDNTGKNPASSPSDWKVTDRGSAQRYSATDLSTLHLVEDVIFDKRRSRLYYDIQGIGLIVPALKTQAQEFAEPKGWFKYKDLERIFRAHPKKAIWFNRQNTAQNKNFADAMLLRMFHATLFMIENPEGESIYEKYGDRRQAVMATEWEEMRLMEKEHNLWEF